MLPGVLQALPQRKLLLVQELIQGLPLVLLQFGKAFPKRIVHIFGDSFWR